MDLNEISEHFKRVSNILKERKNATLGRKRVNK